MLATHLRQFEKLMSEAATIAAQIRDIEAANRMIHHARALGTRVYLAADFARQAEMREVRDALAAAGVAVTSRWIDVDVTTGAEQTMVTDARPGSLEAIRNSDHALDDLEDVRRADVLVQFTTGEKARGGRHVELGFAIGMGKRVAIVGPREHIFHWIVDDSTLRFATVAEFLAEARTW